MLNESSLIILIIAAFFFGVRHGFDWDHIAAISSITGTTHKDKKIVANSQYIIGHAFVIVLLGLCAIVLGLTLPEWIDTMMEPLVGTTLIILGVYLIITVIRSGNIQLMSRWMLLAHMFKKITGKQLPTGAFLLGMIHGIGAETPTQLLLFLTIVGVSGKEIGILLLFFFVGGLLLSHSVLCLSIVVGYAHLHKRKLLYRGIGLLSGGISIGIGILFVFNQGNILPIFL